MSRTLGGHAGLVTARCEAPPTTYPCVSGHRHDPAKEKAVLAASSRWWATVSDRVNVSEHPIKIVIHNKPKMLTGLNQKVSGQEWELTVSPSMGVAPPVDRMDLLRIKSRKRNTVSPMPSLRVARSQDNAMGQWVEESGKSEGRPVTGRIGVDRKGHHSPRKRADFHGVVLCEIVCRTPEGRNCK